MIASCDPRGRGFGKLLTCVHMQMFAKSLRLVSDKKRVCKWCLDKLSTLDAFHPFFLHLTGMSEENLTLVGSSNISGNGGKLGFHKWQCAARGNVAKSYYKANSDTMNGWQEWHGILSRHVLTVLLSLAGCLQNACHSEQRASGDCSSAVLSILKINMIDESYGVKSNLRHSFTTCPLHVWHHTMQWLQQGFRGESRHHIRTVRPSCRLDPRVPLTFLFSQVFGKIKDKPGYQ